MKKKERLFSENEKNIFEFNFGFSYPVASWNTYGRKDKRTKEHGKQRIELNKNKK